MSLIYCIKDKLSVETSFFCKACIFYKATQQKDIATYQCDYKNWNPGITQNRKENDRFNNGHNNR